MAQRLKRPRDPNQLAHLVVQIATGEIEDKQPDDGKNPAAVALSKLGASKGGHARAKSLSVKRKRAIAKAAAKARWAKKKKFLP